MADIDIPRAAFRSVSAIEQVAEALSRGIARLTAWNEARLTRQALMRLSASELDDIGLTQSDIDQVARDRFL